MKEQVLKYFNQLLSEVSDAEKEQLDLELSKIYPKDKNSTVKLFVGMHINDEVEKNAECNVSIVVNPILNTKIKEAQFIEIDNTLLNIIPKGIDTKFSFMLDNVVEEELILLHDIFSDVIQYKLCPVKLSMWQSMAISPTHGALRFTFKADGKRYL